MQVVQANRENLQRIINVINTYHEAKLRRCGSDAPGKWQGDAGGRNTNDSHSTKFVQPVKIPTTSTKVLFDIAGLFCTLSVTNF